MNPTFTSSLPPVVNLLEEARKRLIVALDVPDAASAAALVSRLEGKCDWFKVGLELFVAAGPAVLEPLGVRMITVHAAGGPAMLSAAHAALDGIADPPELLAVTVLTSIDAAQISAVGLERSPAEQVELLARMGLAAGMHGFVCSPWEVAALRRLTGPEGVLVVPGIRPAGSDTGDQKRIATPAEALRLGANYLVVGRPITLASDPAEAAEAILKEMAEALDK